MKHHPTSELKKAIDRLFNPKNKNRVDDAGLLFNLVTERDELRDFALAHARSCEWCTLIASRQAKSYNKEMKPLYACTKHAGDDWDDSPWADLLRSLNETL